MRHLTASGLVLCLALIAAPGASAQSGTFGARLGTSVATLDTDADDVLQEENRTGLVAGVFYNRSYGLIGTQFEVLYARRGSDFADGSAIDLTYVTIPALVKVAVPVGLVRPGVFGGVALALNVDCEVEDTETTACDDVAGVSVNDVDFNAVVGADVQVGLAGLSLWGDGRYYVGLSDVGEFEDVLQDVKHRSWEFTAGVGLPVP